MLRTWNLKKSDFVRQGKNTVQQTGIFYNHGQKSCDTFAFLGRFPIHTGPTHHPTNNVGCEYQEFFSEFQLCVEWGREKCKKISKRMHCLMREPRNDRKITILQYCPRDFCPWLKLCRFRKGFVHTNPDRLKPNTFFSHEKTFLPSLRSLKKSTLKSQSNPHGFRSTKR